MVWQHNTAGTYTDRIGAAGNVTYTHGGGSAGDAGKVVVFGQPKSLEASSLGILREVESVRQRVGRGKAFTNIGKVENGEL